MIVYLAMLTFICFLAFGSTFLPRKFRIARGGISLIGYTTMCIFVGLRDHVGADWDSYEHIFDLFGRLPIFVTLFITEPLYGFCNHFVHFIGGDIHLVNLICAAILLTCLFNFSRLVDMDANLLLFIATPYLLFVVGMGYTRQSVALGLVLNAVGYLRDGRQRMFYFFVVVAALFHYSAIFLLLLWWVNSAKRIWVVLAALALVSPVLIPILLSKRYVLYLNNNAAMQSHGVWTRILLISMALLIIFAQKLKWTNETLLRRIIFRGAVALCGLAVLSLFLSTLADRICLNLFFIYVLGLGSVTRYATSQPLKYLSICFVVCLSYGIFLTWFGLSEFAAAAWFPYGIALYSGS